MSIGRSCGNTKMELNSGKNPQKMEKKKSSPTCYINEQNDDLDHI